MIAFELTAYVPTMNAIPVSRPRRQQEYFKLDARGAAILGNRSPKRTSNFALPFEDIARLAAKMSKKRGHLASASMRPIDVRTLLVASGKVSISRSMPTPASTIDTRFPIGLVDQLMCNIKVF